MFERTAETPACVVLAVDDDPLVLMNTVMMLEDLGHKVFKARSGKQALELLGREPSIELVVTDMAMPDMSGVELFGNAQSRFPTLRFVLATGYGEAFDDCEPGLLRLSKPFGLHDLARAIETAMGVGPGV